jgi:gliding motility-associated-like protein
MHKRIIILWFLTIVLGFWATETAFATHLRGGEITLKRLSDNSLAYKITVTTYTDYVGGLAANNNQNEVDIVIYNAGQRVAFFKIQRQSRSRIRDDTEKNVYEGEYTFRAPGAYLIGSNIENRNADVVNMSKSSASSFYIETIVVVNTELGLNGTPLLLNPAVDFTANVGQRFSHNPNAYDTEGDSLAFRLTKPRLITDGSVFPVVVNDYRDPTQAPSGGQNETKNGPAVFMIDSLTGELIWDAPAAKGQYNVAFEILEYRNGVLISITVRDMQIIVKEGKNTRPKLQIPQELCVQAGEKISINISASDAEGNPIIISATGPVFEKPDGTATIPPQIPGPWASFGFGTAPKAAPATGTFTWQTSCDHIRLKAYEVLFKAEDVPSGTEPKLLDSKIWKIRIVAPAVLGIAAKPKGSGAVQLDWLKYTCPLPGASLLVYRKLGCTNFEPENCSQGLPASLGYQLIDTLPIDAISYVDKTIENNTEYSYRMVVKFSEDTGGGLSIVSKQSCVSVPLQMPVMTNVTVEKTSKTAGEITVRWSRALGFLPDEATGPYQFKLYRVIGENGTPTLVLTRDTDLSKANSDTTFRDTQLNTSDIQYRYFVELWYSKNGAFTLLDGTLPASSVRLSANPANKAVSLSWQANVPWNNENQTHIVFRQNSSGVYNIIAEVPVGTVASFNYLDDGADKYALDGTENLSLSVDETYCYKVITIGRFKSIDLRPELLINHSQEICASPKDNIKPCAPVLKLDALDCERLKTLACDAVKFENQLSWTTAIGSTCDTTYRGFNIYYSRFEGETMAKIGSIAEGNIRNFTHANLGSFAGCYYITAINRFGNESEPSNKICKDNCPDFLQFPNVITPNNDGKNDDFQPMWCALFIKSIKYVVVNRNGQEVFRSTSTDPLIKWNGTNKDGIELPAGIYYYQAEVTFDRLQKNTTKQTVKGWVEIIR